MRPTQKQPPWGGPAPGPAHRQPHSARRAALRRRQPPPARLPTRPGPWSSPEMTPEAAQVGVAATTSRPDTVQVMGGHVDPTAHAPSPAGTPGRPPSGGGGQRHPDPARSRGHSGPRSGGFSAAPAEGRRGVGASGASRRANDAGGGRVSGGRRPAAAGGLVTSVRLLPPAPETAKGEGQLLGGCAAARPGPGVFPDKGPRESLGSHPSSHEETNGAVSWWPSGSGFRLVTAVAQVQALARELRPTTSSPQKEKMYWD